MDRRDLLKGAAGTTLLAATSGLAAADNAPPVLRIHPAIGIARVGNSPDYYLAPETAAGELPSSGDGLWGGLPLDATTGRPITADGFRDGQGRLKRQAVRFRIYAYTGSGWPTGESTEVTLGALIGGKRVADIVWQAHIANKKLNCFSMEDTPGHFPALAGFADGRLMPIRRPQDGPLDSPDRLRRLVIDPGPRALSARADQSRVTAFAHGTPASCLGDGGTVRALPDYPVSFPQDHFTLHIPAYPLTSLGDMRVEAGTGRLILAGGFGATVGIMTPEGRPNVNERSGAENTSWFDDIGDGPVSARIIFEDGSSLSAAPAWVMCGDPGFAPQTRNVVTAWDEVYDTFVRQLALEPDLYAGGTFSPRFAASFADDARPLFHAVMLQRWNTNLPAPAIAAHNRIGAITPADRPTDKIPDFDGLIRNPDNPASLAAGTPMMPLALGDTDRPFLTLTPTQYYLLRQWHKGAFTPERRLKLGAGEEMDRVALANCLGGRFSPGIEVSYPVRDPNLFIQDWARTPGGPFRLNAAPLDYSKARPDRAFLTVGYIPLRPIPLEPGDFSKFMAAPWHTDYNHCASHPPESPSNTDQTLYWSWPAERPVAVYPQALARFNPGTGWTPGRQLYAVRGAGTTTIYPANAGRFQKAADFLVNWHKVGFVVQASRINPDARPATAEDPFLEVACVFETDTSQMVAPWPTFNSPPAP